MKTQGFFGAVADHPVAVLMFFAATVVFGSVSYERLPITLMPDISYPTLTVRTEVPGAAPEEVESEISRMLEAALATTEGIVELESRSRAELSDVVMEFAWGTDMDQASQAVRERLQTTFLPGGADRPLILRYDPSQDPILKVSLSVDPEAKERPSERETLFRLREIADDEIKTALEALDGVAAVRVRGGYSREIRIELRQDWLDARGLTASDVRGALVSQNVNISGGSIREGETEYLIRTLNQFTTLEEIGDAVVRSNDGVLLRVSDVAEVSVAHKDRELVSHLDGEESVELEIYREADANIVQVAGTVKRALGLGGGFAGAFGDDDNSIGARLPSWAELAAYDDQASFIEAAITNLRGTAVWGGLLAISVLFLFLADFRVTAIIATAIPVSVICTFAPMYLGGVSLNLMSLGGLALGVGMLVDNAIVVLENIQVQREQGADRRLAAVEGTRQVAQAVTASTLTTVAVFLPIVFVEGVAGQIFGDLALAVVFSLLASLVVALLLVPMLAARNFAVQERPKFREITPAFKFQSWGVFKASMKAARGWRRLLYPYYLARFFAALGVELFVIQAVSFAAGLVRVFVRVGRAFIPTLARWSQVGADRFGRAFERLHSRYAQWLEQALAIPGRVVLLSFALFLMALWGLGRLGVELLPEVHQGRFAVELSMPVGTPLDRTVKVSELAEAEVQQIPGVARVHAVIGSDGRADAKSDEGEHSARLLVQLQPDGDYKVLEKQVADQVRGRLQRLPDTNVGFASPSLFSFKTPIEVVVQGDDLVVLRAVADRVVERLESIRSLKDVRTSLTTGFPEIRIEYDRLQLQRYGLTPSQVANSVRDRLQGMDAEKLTSGERRVDMTVRLAEDDRRTVEQLRRLNVAGSNGTLIPLEAIASLKEGVGPSEIRRVDQRRVAVITADLAGFDLAGAASSIEQALSDEYWPPGTGFEISGQVREMGTSLDSMRFALMLAIFLVYAIMSSTFENLVHPFVIMASLPLALVGVTIGLGLFGVPVSVVVLIGTIVLAGVVVNNAIVLVDTINRHWRGGMSRLDAIRSASRLRLRPIAITTATTVLALLPLALGAGEGAEIQRPLALVLIFGLISSTALTLIVIPVVYERVTAWLPERALKAHGADQRTQGASAE